MAKKSKEVELEVGEDTDTSAADAADAALIAEMKQSVSEADENANETDGDADEVEIVHDDEPTPSRKERRANRYREAMDRAEAAERRAAEMDERLRRMESLQVEAIRQRTAAPAKDPMESIYERQQELYRQFNLEAQSGQMTRETEESYVKKYRALEQEKLRAVVSEQMRATQAQLVEQTRIETIRQRNADVMGNQKASQWAQARYHMLLASGEQDGEALAERAIEDARKEFRLGKHSAPSKSEQSRYTATPSSRSSAGQESQPFRMNRDYKRMADEFGKHIKDPQKRYQYWYNMVGKDIVNGKT